MMLSSAGLAVSQIMLSINPMSATRMVYLEWYSSSLNRKWVAWLICMKVASWWDWGKLRKTCQVSWCNKSNIKLSKNKARTTPQHFWQLVTIITTPSYRLLTSYGSAQCLQENVRSMSWPCLYTSQSFLLCH